VLDNRKLVWVLAGLLVVAVAAFGWSLTRGYDQKKEEVRPKVAEKGEDEAKQACASAATYARLKEVAFEEAVRLGAGDPANLDTLAAHSVVRMEEPVVLNRDESLNVTVCSGRFILELPPGAEAAFGGERRLTAQIEYAAQEAADGSGLVYQIRGAEPIIQKLSAFNLGRTRVAPPSAPAADDRYAEAPVPAEATPLPPFAAPPPVVRPRPTTPPAAEPAPPRSAAARPSFNCRHANARSERMVCSSDRLARLDRSMSSLFYSALADADSRTRSELRRTRDRFLAYREGCRNEACVAEAYEGRMEEIRDIMAGRD
jgi:hypothetical protein